MAVVRRARSRVAAVVASLFLVAPVDSSAVEPTLRALIVAPSQYDYKTTGWLPLHSHNDVPLIAAGLERRGFRPEHITVLSGKVTRSDAEQALRGFTVGAGDHVYVHYSGHGQRITDQAGGDESDGYDESLAFVDTPANGEHAEGRYGGERHLRDDDLGQLLAELRDRVGPRGSLAVVLDSCHSGTATRGLPARGYGDFDLGRPGKTHKERDGGGFADVLAESPERAPMIVLSAARSNEPAREVYGPDGLPAGALSVALAQVLAEEPGLDSWSAVYERVVARMRRSVPGQLAQLEGARDTKLFDGSRVDVPFYAEVAAVSEDGSRLQLRAGVLLGLSVDSVLEVHRAGTSKPSDASLLGVGTVREATAVASTLVLERPLPRASDIDGARVYVRSLAAADLKLKVKLSLDDDHVAEAWRSAFGELKLVEVVEDAPDFTVFQRGTSVYLVDGTPPTGPAPSDVHGTFGFAATPPRDLLLQLSDRARAHLLAAVDIQDDRYQISAQILPARWTGSDRGASDCREDGPHVTGGGERRFEVGDAALVRVTLEGEPAHISMVVTSAAGKSEQIYPLPNEAWDAPEQAGIIFEECIPVTWSAGSRPGVPAVESLKVFASPSPESIDFRRVLGAPLGTRGKRQPEGALELLWSTANQTRGLGRTQRPQQGGATTVVTYVVEPPS